ncbi:MAG: NAD(P)-dependent oxidoreductase [Bacteroidetes bacterium]|nr:NAD(P)-dependent oxidoreductase [Bacteroidota bacterium]
MAIESNRLSEEVLKDFFSDIHPPFEYDEGAVIEANRCINCYDAPCTKLCPTHIDVPLFIKQISSGNIKGSARTIFLSNIMGTGCSKVCPVEKLCEGACVFNLLKEEPVPIAKLQRYSTEKALKEKWNLLIRKESTGKKVAVVGAGPAGLACAHELSLNGVDVTVFEKEEKPGGLMTYGIAAYKVTPEFCKEEVDYITAIGGIEIRTGITLGKDITLRELREKFDAVFLGIGVGKTRGLKIPGEELEGVVDAINFIYNLRTSDYSKVAVGDKVAVIGMGMTAIDAATQSKRLGAKEVTMIYRRSENEKPCTDSQLDIARLDGCHIIWLAAPKEIIGENGKVKKLVCNKMKLGDIDSSGRLSPVETGETFTLEVDMVIKATGQLPYEELIGKSSIRAREGKIVISENSETNIPGVFAGGDAVNGGKEVVNAVQDGKNGAKAILTYIGI